MTLELETPQGKMQLTVTQGFAGQVEVTPEGVVTFSLFPEENPELSESEESGFIND